MIKIGTQGGDTARKASNPKTSIRIFSTFETQ